MEICEDGHDEIVFIKNRRTSCPLCAANEEIQELQDQISNMTDEQESAPKP